ncbi:MAG TPA: hypothetical protein VEB64_03220, partial [Azospirillaceae bacterium]|nr:hypothetical protein [Azospirillaceae bacterium]
MAFASTDLSVLAYANGFTLWHYLTTDGHTVVDTSGYFDAAAAVDTVGYFNGAADMLRVGDMILANTGVGGTPAAGVLVIAA